MVFDLKRMSVNVLELFFPTSILYLEPRDVCGKQRNLFYHEGLFVTTVLQYRVHADLETCRSIL